jgi:hypothetical protein
MVLAILLAVRVADAQDKQKLGVLAVVFFLGTESGADAR